jgi:ligand-binding sensor domain-containing protein/prolipoprotein diacylglyceryltransferase/AraC-like DNA-binding protein
MDINIFRPLFGLLGIPYVGPYFTILLLSFLIAFPLTALLAPRFSLRSGRLLLLTATVIAASLIGSKVFHLFFDEQWARYAAVFREQGVLAFLATVLNPFSAGHVFYGGLAAGYGAGWILVRRIWREPTGRYADVAAFPVAFGLFLARIGCFLAGCCFGRPSVAFGVSFPAYSPAATELYLQQVTDSYMEATPPLIPTQLIEAAAALGIFVYLCRRLGDIARLPAGFFMERCLLLYAVFRFCIEFLRADMRGSLLWLSTGQWISLLILAVLWIIRWRNSRRPIGPIGLMGPMGLIGAAVTVFFSTTAWALPPEKKLHHYVAQHWSVKDGLPHNSVQAIVRSSDGFVWLATPEGLARFDGGAFTLFGKKDIPGLASIRFTAIAIERNGTLWAGTEAGEIVRYDAGRFTLFNRDSALPAAPVRCIVTHTEGPWAVIGKETVHLSGDKFARSNAAERGADPLLALDTTGRVIAAAETQLTVLTAGAHERTTFSQLTGKTLSALAFDRSGALWIGTASGEVIRLSNLSDTAGKVLRKADGIPVTALAEDEKSMWAGTQGTGLLRFHADGAVDTFGERNGLHGQSVRALHRDTDGNLWVGTEEGLDLFSDGAAMTLTTLDGLSNNLVYAIIEDTDGSLWIGTRGGGLNHYADGKFTVYTTKEGLPSNLIGALSRDDDGTLWIGSTGGLTALRNGKMTTYTARDGLSNNVIGAIARDRKGELWVGTLNGDVNLFNGKNSFRIFQIGHPLTASLIHQIFEDRSGRLWVAAQFGLSLFNNGFIKTWSATPDGLNAPMALALLEDGDMNLWIGTHRGGLNLYREGKFTALTARNGLPADDVYAILLDDADRLWLSTDNGILYLPRKELISFLDGTGPQLTPGAIGLADGMKTLECTGGVQPVALRSKSGLLYFSTIKGLVAVDPKKVGAATPPPRAYIASLSAGDKALPQRDTVQLPADNASFTIGLATMALKRTGAPTFRYRLEGIDDGWKETDEATIRYADLPPGTYELSVSTAMKKDTFGPATHLTLVVEQDHTMRFIGTAVALLFLIGLAFLLGKRKLRRPATLPPLVLAPEPRGQAHKLPDPEPSQAHKLPDPEPDPEPRDQAHKLPDPFPEKPRYEKSRIDDDTAGTIVGLILKYLETKKPYKNPDLTLANLADQIDLTPHLLSQLLNDRLNKNFNNFINSYRVDEVKSMLEDPANRDKLLAIAYDAGFRSKTTFNTIFKKFTGKTPSEYRRSLDGGTFIDSDDMPD